MVSTFEKLKNRHFFGSVFAPAKRRTRSVTQPFVTFRVRHFRALKTGPLLFLGLRNIGPPKMILLYCGFLFSLGRLAISTNKLSSDLSVMVGVASRVSLGPLWSGQTSTTLVFRTSLDFIEFEHWMHTPAHVIEKTIPYR